MTTKSSEATTRTLPTEGTRDKKQENRLHEDISTRVNRSSRDSKNIEDKKSSRDASNHKDI